MSILDIFRSVDNAISVVGEAVEDKDLTNTLRTEVDKLREAVYMKELDTKTVGWVDAFHKMGRQLTGYLGYGLAFYMVHQGYDPMAAMAAVAPGGLYAVFKNKGK